MALPEDRSFVGPSDAGGRAEERLCRIVTLLTHNLNNKVTMERGFTAVGTCEKFMVFNGMTVLYSARNPDRRRARGVFASRDIFLQRKEMCCLAGSGSTKKQDTVTDGWCGGCWTIHVSMAVVAAVSGSGRLSFKKDTRTDSPLPDKEIHDKIYDPVIGGDGIIIFCCVTRKAAATPGQCRNHKRVMLLF